ncbi:MAG TPA: TlyA family RNA methyltransferase [Bryobacteraceae bacterium]|jgi:23S rRNA (cytidine1920-2'-O)/16S rRNA (cytidine1409-2'-O)-methyltransferase
MTAKPRLDQLLVDRGLVESREKAKALIIAGEVTVDGQKQTKPGHTVSLEVRIELLSKPRYVGRGGLKLEGALTHFAIDPAGLTCLDIGSSTGGFTDCLLQHGAAKVYAIDSGTNQLDWKLRNDPRVIVRENFNARLLESAQVPEPIDLLVCDVSFISVTLVLPPAILLLREHASMVILIKPQFEAGRQQVGKGGIVRDRGVHEQVCRRIESFVQELGFQTSIIDSPILGAEGNREFLLYAHR